MQVYERFSEAVGGFFVGRHEVIRIPEEFVEIQDIALSASKIWFDTKDKKEERFAEAAKGIQAKLTSKILGDPRFYSELPPVVHMRSLQLLGASEQEGRRAIREACLRENTEIPEVFDTGEVGQMLRSYLTGLVKYEVVFESPYEGESRVKANRRYLGLWTDIPSDLLDRMCPLPLRKVPVPIDIFNSPLRVTHIAPNTLLPVSA